MRRGVTSWSWSRTMSAARQVAERYFSAVGQGNVDAALATFASDAEFRGPMGRLPVPDGIRAYLEGYVSSFPGSRFEVMHAVEAGDDVVLEGDWVGTHSGPLPLPDGNMIPPTGKDVRVPFVTVFHVERDKITAHRGYWDMAGFMGQLGLGQA
jgi:steroid delta-isomerase-like uncharacterized protein